MGLQATIQKITKTAVNKSIGDLKETVTFTHKGISARDPITRNITSTDVTETADSVIAVFSKQEIDNMAIRSTDLKLIIPSLNLESGDPKKTDEVTRADGSSWSIAAFKQDTAKAMWVIALRGK